MTFSINNFISNLSGDGLRPNLFEIDLVSPLGSPNNIRFKAKATTIPSSSVGIMNVFYYGRRVKFAGNRDFDNWTVNILMDESDYNTGRVRGLFEQWSSFLNQHEGNSRQTLTNPNIYYGQAIVYHKRKDNTGDAGKYIMNGCFPIEIGPMSLDWADNNRIAEFSVTFAYQWWTSFAVNN